MPAPPPYEDPADAAYAHSLPTLLGSPLPATSQLLRTHRDDCFSGAQEWMSEKSRGELSDLLLKAGDVIKDRENELTLTSTVCKNLFENNLILKAKHETLASRIPNISRPASPSSISMSTDSANMSPIWSPIASPKRTTHRRCLGHMSASPSELDRLADQNAELLSKLEELETEALCADKAGKRKLQSLEREIQVLRDELERTHEMSQKLEKQMSNMPYGSALTAGLDDDLVKLWKKLDREAKVRALKAKTRPWELRNNPDGAPKDFAPASRPSDSGLHFFNRHAESGLMSVPSLSSVDADGPASPQMSAQSISPSGSHSIGLSVGQSSISPSVGAREFAIVSRLLLKIRELEETNGHLSAQHTETRLKLKQAEKDAEEVRHLYEVIGGAAGVELEMTLDGFENAGADIQDANPDSSYESARSWNDEESSRLSMSSFSSPGSVRSRIKFKSLKNGRSLKLDLAQVGINFEEGISARMHSTLREGLARQTVDQEKGTTGEDIALLDSGTDSHESPLLLFQRTQGHKSRKSILGLFGDDDGHSSSLELGNFDGKEPGGSRPPTLNITSPTPGRPVPSSLHTSSCDSHDHQAFSLPPSANTPPISPVLSSARNSVILIQNNDGSIRPRTLGSELGDELQTDMNFSHLRSTSLYELLRSANDPEDDRRGTSDYGPPFGEHSPVSPHGTLQLLHQSFASHLSERDPRIYAHGSKILGTEHDIELSSTYFDDSREGGRMKRKNASTSSSQSIHTRHSHTESHIQAQRSREQDGIASFLLEIWLWLQFIIIITAFVWAMAKRGPKQVLRTSIHASNAELASSMR